MIDHIVFDVEIAKTIEEVGGWDHTDKMGISVACVWEHIGQRMRVYGPDDVEALRARLLKADRISSYNGYNFDYPVVWGISKPSWLAAKDEDPSKLPYSLRELKSMLTPKTNDILRRIWTALGFNPDVYDRRMGGAKLDDIAGATLGVRKIGNGADAPKWFQAGLVQKVANYCADDVAIERDLAEFVDRYGFVIHNGKQLFLKR